VGVKEKSKKRDKRAEPKIVIPLKRPYAQLALGALLFGACAAFFFYRASTNDRGLILNGIIHFEPGGADVFYAVMGLLSAGFVVIAALGILRISQIQNFTLVIGARSVSLPVGKPMGMRMHEIPIADLVSIGKHPPASPKHVILQARQGTHWIPTSWLPEGWTADGLADELVARMRRDQDER